MKKIFTYIKVDNDMWAPSDYVGTIAKVNKIRSTQYNTWADVTLWDGKEDKICLDNKRINYGGYDTEYYLEDFISQKLEM